MSEYTKENPFEFLGARAWREDGNVILGGVGPSIHNQGTFRAAVTHAFIEAERIGWHWTNDDHTEARNGRWTVAKGDNGPYRDQWTIRHDDFPGTGWNAQHHQAMDMKVNRNEHTAAHIRESFLTWRAEQDQPEEPTGLGAVVEAAGERYTHAPDDENDDVPWVRYNSGGWVDWSGILKSGPVTVLSEGVQP